MTENDPCKKKSKSKLSLRSLRLSLKYRPELLKLILKMRQCIRRRNSLLKSLKHRLKELETNKAKININVAANLPNKDETLESVSLESQSLTHVRTKEFQDSTTQTYSNVKDQDTKAGAAERDIPKVNAGWNVKKNGDVEKSIAEQVKEAAQSALQDNGMVYVESAGMYYDYKTGYYYNSELGLYYHSDTGCYYHYSEDKQFVFHSYPDMSKVNSSLIAHQQKKARKLKRDKEEDGSNPKKPRKAKKTKKEKKDKGKKKTKKQRKEEKIEVVVDKKVEVEKKMDVAEETMDVTEEKKDVSEEKIEGIEKNKMVTEDKLVKIDVSTEKSHTEIETTKIEKADNVPTETKNQDDSRSMEQNDNTCAVDDIFDNTDKSELKIESDGKTESNIFSIIDINIDNENKEQKENKVKNEIKEESEIKVQVKEEQKREELEDGECSETESEDSESDGSTSTVSDEDSVAKNHPPCMRVIVRETKLAKLKVGSLFLITKDGGTVGREGEQHAILLKDHNVSRNHLDIRYDTARNTYLATDLGSKNGTILNGVRMSESLETSGALDVLHGSTIQLGETKLLCHVHPGHSTCGQCEPGLLMQVEEEKKTAYTRTVSVKKQYELELARLKNIYVPQRLAIEEKPYNDRAQARREAVGSTNHAEKTQASDLDTSIAADNKGFKLLQKMGWSEGEGLGKDSQGDIEPVPLVNNDGKAGLGTAGAVAPPSNTPKARVVRNNLAAATLRLAARTKMLQPPAKAFQIEDEDSE